MDKSEYHPIDCALHERYQLAVMRRDWLLLRWRDSGGLSEQSVLPMDVFSRSGAEYLRAETRAGTALVLRLDQIVRAERQKDGILLYRRDGT